MELLKTSKDLKYWFLNYVIWKSKADKLFQQSVLIYMGSNFRHGSPKWSFGPFKQHLNSK